MTAPTTLPSGERLTIPSNQVDLEDMLNDHSQVTKLSRQGDLTAAIDAYARGVAKTDMDIKTQVAEQVQASLAEFLRDSYPDGVDRPNLVPAALPAQGNFKNTLHNPRAMGAALDKEFAGPTAVADYFATIWHQANRTADVQAKLNRIRNAFSSTVPSEGGFLIPESLRSEILSVSLENAVVRPRARVIPMETLRVPFPAIDSTSNVSSLFGGIVTYWTEEAAALTASNASFGRVVLEAKKLTAYCEVPNELISDSLGSFQTFLDQIFPEALGFGEDYAFIAGTGVGEPLGFLNAPSSISVSKETSQPAATIVWENIVKMYSRMLPSSLSRAVWVCSHDTFPQLATMALAVGTGGSAVWLNNGVSASPGTILGRPIIMTEKTSVLGTAGDINFVDFGYYLVGDRQVMSAMSSPHYTFNTDRTAYRIIQRVDGRPWLNSAITPKNNGATLSPFVKLETRA